jgi:hypothetical protein
VGAGSVCGGGHFTRHVLHRKQPALNPELQLVQVPVPVGMQVTDPRCRHKPSALYCTFATDAWAVFGGLIYYSSVAADNMTLLPACRPACRTALLQGCHHRMCWTPTSHSVQV